MQRNIVKLSGATFHIFIVCIGCVRSLTPHHIHHYCEIVLFVILFCIDKCFLLGRSTLGSDSSFGCSHENGMLIDQFSNPSIYNILPLYWVESSLTTPPPPSLNVYLRRPCKQEAKPSYWRIELLLIKSLCLFDRQTSERASI